MEIPAKEIIGAVIAISGGYFGYVQWKRSSRSGSYISDRQAAYKTAWSALEAVHLYVRQGDFDRSHFDDLLKNANSEMITQGLHISDVDRRLATTYLDSLLRLGSFLTALPRESQFRRQVAVTGENPVVPSGYRESWQAFEAARSAVVESFRRSVGAGQI